MEPLWSPAVATGGNQRQTVRHRVRLKQAQTVAAGCYWLPNEAHGKGRVDTTSLLLSRESTQSPNGSAAGRVPPELTRATHDLLRVVQAVASALSTAHRRVGQVGHVAPCIRPGTVCGERAEKLPGVGVFWHSVKALRLHRR
jgi:hypothetical protein